MSFQVNDLTEDDPFFVDARSTPYVAVGEGQKVYWKDCILKIYKSTDTSKPIETLDTASDGEGLVLKGTTVWFGGKNGKVKEA
ncbi:hypothetical protein BHE90_010084 [Fusarium euwallaceae]|uniref:Uncharacterized protein n=1 Tax=Fusarium euwallaceae TaxID=1147111 RepID=A0A430LIC6_9HYPO|nr:hypothetical protein BHE90_010084 [Fusarium euwallaceae]